MGFKFEGHKTGHHLGQPCDLETGARRMVVKVIESQGTFTILKLCAILT